MELETVPIEKPDDVNLILGQSHFIKTVDDVYEALAGSSPSCVSVLRSASRPGHVSFGAPGTMTSSSRSPSRTRWQWERAILWSSFCAKAFR